MRTKGLGALLLLVAVNALGGGLYGLAGAEAVPREWLQGSPFTTYLVPSLVLLIGVGGLHGLAAYAVFARHRHARRAAMVAGVFLVLWIVVQVMMIGYVSPLQPVMAVAGVGIVLLALGLPGPQGASPRSTS